MPSEASPHRVNGLRQTVSSHEYAEIGAAKNFEEDSKMLMAVPHAGVPGPLQFFTYLHSHVRNPGAVDADEVLRYVRRLLEACK